MGVVLTERDERRLVVEDIGIDHIGRIRAGVGNSAVVSNCGAGSSSGPSNVVRQRRR